MDVERTMQFILEQQAKTEALLATIGANQARGDKQILAMRKVIWAGIKLVSDIGQRQAATDERMKQTDELIKQNAEQIKQMAEERRETDAKFKQLMDLLLKQNKNGH